mgnify:CR=1 FL=1
MRYINTLCEGETIRNIYLCKGKRSAETRNGKPYDNLILQGQDREHWTGRSGIQIPEESQIMMKWILLKCMERSSAITMRFR